MADSEQRLRQARSVDLPQGLAVVSEGSPAGGYGRCMPLLAGVKGKSPARRF
jgi:hypothetical protein